MEDVLTGKRLAGELERLCVERCIRLVQKETIFFDNDEANRVIDIVGFFRHTKGKYAGKLFELMPWQEFFLVMLFGMKYVVSDLRLFRTALLCVPKKNGKSEFSGAIGTIMTFFEDEEGAECYSAANKLDQAKYSWEASMKILKRLRLESESINNDLGLYNSTNNCNLVNRSNDSFFKPISADSKTLDGVNPQFAAIDEFHEAKTNDIPNNMESGMVSREQPLLLYTTTRGFNIQGPLFRMEQSFELILKGELEDDEVFPLIYTLDPDDDWEDESLWIKANPGLGRTPTLEGLRGLYTKAKTRGSSHEINFKTKNLNIWTSVAARWVKDSDFIAGRSTWDRSELSGLMCFAGLDLAKTRDLTAVSYFFPPQAGFDKFRVLTRYFMPTISAKECEADDMVPYEDWARAGWLTLTPGNVRDDSHIMATIMNDCREFDVKGISYDPWNATTLAVNLTEEEVEMNEFRQNTSNFNEPITHLEGIVMSHELDCGGDPMMRWMFGNIEIYTDGNGNRKFDKQRSRQKIDGPVALAMGVAEWLDYKITDPGSWDKIIWK
jgi:phage terminase large subunit-like protein